MFEIQIEPSSTESTDFVEFMSKHDDDIQAFFPHYSEDDAYYGSVYVLKIKDEIIGTFIYQAKGEELHVDVDYVIENYRDVGVGQEFFIQKLDEFRKMGFGVVVALTANAKHISYLKKCNFYHSTKHPDRYELQLS